MNEELEKLDREIEKTETKLRRAEQQVKILKHQAKNLTRRERTHRLCTRGAMLESYLPCPESVTDEQAGLILRLLFHQSRAQEIIEQVLSQNSQNEQMPHVGRVELFSK